MSRRKEQEQVQCVLSADDRDALFAVSPDGVGLACMLMQCGL